MNWFEAAFLGLIQGLTEFLPISSSAHLFVVGKFLPSGADPGAAFTAVSQLGTETAVLVFFWGDIVRIIKAWWGSLRGRVPRNNPDVRMGWLVILGSIPIAFLGVLFQHHIESTLRNLWLVATTLIVFGLFLAVADAVAPQRRELKDLSYKHGIIYGFAQALALIPGVSRSGGTITAGLLMGYKREAAARYSFWPFQQCLGAASTSYTKSSRSMKAPKGRLELAKLLWLRSSPSWWDISSLAGS